MQIAQVLAGYSLGEADLLRRAMGKKRKEEMDAQRARFIEGAAQKGVDAGQASFIFDLVAKFAGYGFNKSHAAAYALVAYQTAYLKANFPVAFLAASMTLDMHNTDKLAGFVGEARRLGIPVLAPDVNASEAAFAVEDEGRAIRYALAAVKNVGHAAMEALVAERRRNGVFSTLYDLGERLDPTVLNKRMLENLIRAGALDGLNANRAQSLAATDIVLKASHDAAARKASAQVSLFGAAEMAATLPPLPQVDGWDPLKSLEEERAAIGFYLSAHPLDAYRPLLEARGVVPAATAIAGDGPRAAMLAGVIEGLAERKAKSGTPFVSLALSDGSGPYEVTFFRELMADARRLHLAGAPVLITVAVEKMAGSDRVNLTAKAIVSLEEAAAQAVKGVRIFLTHAGPVAALQALLAANRGGRGRVSLNLLLGDGREVEIEVPGGYKITPEVRGALAGVDGVTQAVLL